MNFKFMMFTRRGKWAETEEVAHPLVRALEGPVAGVIFLMG